MHAYISFCCCCCDECMCVHIRQCVVKDRGGGGVVAVCVRAFVCVYACVCGRDGEGDYYLNRGKIGLILGGRCNARCVCVCVSVAVN